MRLVRSVKVLGTAAVAATALAVPVLFDAPGAGAMTLKPTGFVTVSSHGNGHGHGMSQYGAEGAAMSGKTYAQILSFYYPGTTLATLPDSRIRVLLSGTGNDTRVRFDNGLSVTHYGVLSTPGASWYRLVSGSGTSLTLQALVARKWTTVKTGLPNGVAFTRGWNRTTRIRFTDGSQGRYFGRLRALHRDGAAGVDTVDVLSLDNYTRGVVPYEMPSSWRPAAVQAQAVAARTYGRYAVEHPRSTHYDICDTTWCQVYNGYAQFAPDGTQTGWDDPAAIANNHNQVLQYGGSTIFAEFSASNGGWSTDGGHPYLVAKADPYDDADGADPYTLQQKRIKVAQLAKYFGLAKATSIVVTKRDGNGDWGGRVVAGYIKGTDAAGKAVTKNFDGWGLQAAVGVGTTWITLGKISS